MVRASRSLRALSATLIVAFAPQLVAQGKPTIEQFFNVPSPLSITVARKADRVAWNTYERGMRNIYTAAAPDFKPVRLTRFLEDNGIDVTDPQLSDDGSIVVFVRGSAPNRVGWIANPSHEAQGAERAIWAARTNGTGAWRVAEGASPALSPDGRYVLYVKDGQIYRARVTPNGPPTTLDTGAVAFLRQWGVNSNPRWSPDGTKISFVSTRTDHSFIGVYDTKTRKVDFLAPSVDFDNSPVWSPDSKHVAFTRRPGLPFGAQGQDAAAAAGGRGGRGAIPG